MKTVKAKIELSEEDLRNILAKYLGVEPSNVCFNVVKMQRDCEYVTAVITKEIDIPVSSADSIANRTQIAYEHGEYGDAGPGMRANY